MDNQPVTIKIQNQTLTLLPERCVYWHERKTLLASDLHWGKVEVFQRAGIPLSSGVFHDDLKRLGFVIDQVGAQRLVILGDLIHATQGITPEVNHEIKSWRERHPLAIELIKGNHDRGIAPFLEAWSITSHAEEKLEAPFLFSHQDIMREDYYNWSGHVHPTVKLNGPGGSGLRFACFVVGARQGLLPAYSHFTGGQNIKRKPAEKIFAIVENQVLEI